MMSTNPPFNTTNPVLLDKRTVGWDGMRLIDFTPEASSQNYLHRTLKSRDQSPWDTYKREFSCDLAGKAVIVLHRSAPSRTLTLRKYPGEIGAKMLQYFSQLQHENILSAMECFNTDGSIYALCEDLPITLEDIVACDAFLDEAQLAAILKQVLDGLSYLMTEGFEHGSIKCSNILMGLDGTVKIGCLEVIHKRNVSQVQTLEALRTMTVELMEKRLIRDRVPGVNDLTLWPLESDAVEFLAAMSSADSIDYLRKEPLVVKHSGSKGTLIGLARLAIATTATFYSYP